MRQQAIYQLGTLTEFDQRMIRRNWGWFAALGVILTAAGVLGLIASGILSLATTLLIGWIFVIGGVLAVAHAVLRRGWNGFLYDLASGLVTSLIGVLIVTRPLAGLGVMTAAIGVSFLVGGVLWLILALTRANPYGSWTLFHGVIDLLLGGMILSDWPYSSEWVLGTLVTIHLLITGTRRIALGLAARSLVRGNGSPRKQPEVNHRPNPRTPR